MTRVYIAAPYSGKVEIKKGKIVDQSYKSFLESLESVVRSEGFSLYLAHKAADWKIEESAEQAVKKDFEEFKKSDLLVAYPETSRGVAIEIGWASSHHKPIILLVQERENLSYMEKGLSGITNMTIIKFRDIVDMRNRLRETLRKFKSD